MSNLLARPTAPTAKPTTLDPAVQQQLEQLRDIHTPDPVSWFPMAIGWWVLIGLVIIGLIVVYRKWQAHRRFYKHPAYVTAIDELTHLLNESKQQSPQDPAKLAGALSALLKRVGIYRHEPIEVLSGDAWADYLQHGSLQQNGSQSINAQKGDLQPVSFSQAQANFIAHGAYANYDSQKDKSSQMPDLQLLEVTARAWITYQFRQSQATARGQRTNTSYKTADNKTNHRINNKEGL